eukprot:NODE_4012_length_706_cov_93.135464_g3393_i0.p1 GENE.NODE_4012_length_706_cov_93.135464_g3393_i0~~NODE_4012_length_706_cov_93.135464_g3393_i0.p1  ORF type:complete len:120 (+),score=33.03 NODE_4012_length_706_cov_93.135464_g3393_i0:171-530(+)
MRKRMERGKIELDRARAKELEMLLQRYRNVKRGLQGQQNIIKAKTGNILLKHAYNKKTDISGSNAISISVGSGTFGVLKPPSGKHGGALAAMPSGLPAIHTADGVEVASNQGVLLPPIY